MSAPVDVHALRARYAEERSKRIRPEGTAQYVSLRGDDAFLADPFAGRPEPRGPIERELDAVVLGGGFSGVLAAGRLRQAGVDDLLVLDSAADFGGTWYWNRFPGLHCDVESYIYLPLLEETGYVPTQKYASGAEILAYTQLLARHFDLYRNAVFGTRVTSARWDEAAARWRINTDRGDRIGARFLVLGTGAALNRPKLPRIPGMESFEGCSFHTSRWDYAYTGGSADGGMTKLSDKRVAVIGTGATAVQAVPHLAEHAQQLYVFQRTPSAVDERANRPTDVEWLKSQQPGWQQARKANFDLIISGFPQPEDMVGDQWTQIWGMPSFELSADGSPPDLDAMLAKMEEYDLAQMARIRARIDALVTDPATADALKPFYGVRCKRPCFNDEYLQSFNRPNVTLVDTDGRGVEQIGPHTVRANGIDYEVDCVIFATGFEALTSPDRAGDLEVLGRNGTELEETWTKVETLHGVACHGFPNLFVLGGIRHAPITINVTFMITEQSAHVAQVIARVLGSGAAAGEVTEEAVRRWQEEIAAKAMPGDPAAGCTPGFYNNEGRTDEGIPIFATHYGAGPLAYIEVLTDWRDSALEREIEFWPLHPSQET